MHSDTPHPARPAIQHLIAHLHRHGRYEAIFEAFYLEVLGGFYRAESARLAGGDAEASTLASAEASASAEQKENSQLATAAQNEKQQENTSAREFIVHCDVRIAQEMKRAKEVLRESSYEVVRSRTEVALLGGRMGWLAKDGAFLPALSFFLLPFFCFLFFCEAWR